LEICVFVVAVVCEVWGGCWLWVNDFDLVGSLFVGWIN